MVTERSNRLQKAKLRFSNPLAGGSNPSGHARKDIASRQGEGMSSFI